MVNKFLLQVYHHLIFHCVLLLIYIQDTLFLSTIHIIHLYHIHYISKFAREGVQERKYFRRIYNQEILHHEADEYKNKIAEKIEFKEEEELVQSSDKSINLKGLAFCRDSKYGSAILKLNTIEDKLMNKYYRLLDILKMMQEAR